jgi:autonomous glycyl radical cofactor GrcA
VSELASTAIENTLELEESARQLKGSVQDLEGEKEILQRRCSDLIDACSNEEKKRQLALRLVALSDDARSSSLTAMQQKREISVLVQEKKHLQSLLSSLEVNVRALEVNKVRVEGGQLPSSIVEVSRHDDELSFIEDLLFKDPSGEETDAIVRTPIMNSFNSVLSNEDLLAKLQIAGERLGQNKREADDFKVNSPSYSHQLVFNVFF